MAPFGSLRLRITFDARRLHRNTATERKYPGLNDEGREDSFRMFPCDSVAFLQITQPYAHLFYTRHSRFDNKLPVSNGRREIEPSANVGPVYYRTPSRSNKMSLAVLMYSEQHLSGLSFYPRIHFDKTNNRRQENRSQAQCLRRPTVLGVFLGVSKIDEPNRPLINRH